jgi:hypothetical protein
VYLLRLLVCVLIGTAVGGTCGVVVGALFAASILIIILTASLVSFCVTLVLINEFVY